VQQGAAFQTEFASRAYILANVFNKRFQTTEFTGKAPRVVLVMPSMEQSTEGGKLARSSITLKGLAGKSTPPLNAGWFDVGSNVAVLHSYEAVYDLHLQRHGKNDFHLNRDEYDKFVDDMRKFLESEKFNVSIKAGKGGASSSGGSSLGLVLVIALALVAAAGGAALYFLKLQGG
jgi:hypothetical protein